MTAAALHAAPGPIARAGGRADGRVKLPAALVPYFGKEYLSFQ